MAYLRWLLLPFSVLYGAIIWMRNRCYDWGWFRSQGFNKAIIVVGNLAVGGTGKSPMTEYLVRLLSGRYPLATLSRGYGRKTKGFREVNPDDAAAQCGDEPLQFKHKFPHITVAVDEDRVHGVGRLIESGHQAIILDDAYQHRALKPGFSILLFEYQSVFRNKLLLPAGDYRDGFLERRRADVMVVTKTPATATVSDKEYILREMATRRTIPVLFSGIDYGPIVPVLPDNPLDEVQLDPGYSVLLFTGIANPGPLYEYLKGRTKEVVHLRYADHHDYTTSEIRKVISRFTKISNTKKLIITTEKDAQRLLAPALAALLTGLPLFMVPIRISLGHEDEATLRKMVLGYCSSVLGTHAG